VTDDSPSAESIREIIRRVLEQWHETTQGKFVWRPDVRPVVVITVHGLVAHCHRLAEAVMLLEGEGFRLEINPLVRTAYESALTAAWLTHVPDAPEAFVNKEWANRRRQLAGIEAAWGNAIPETEIASAVSQLPTEPHLTLSKKSADNFERLCEDLDPGGKQAYGIYRMLCSNAHPSAWVAEHYLRRDAEGELPTLLNYPDRFGKDDTFELQMLGASVVWSERAMLSLAKAPSAKLLDKLEGASRGLEVAAELRASAVAKDRTPRT
jgi:hypothetical protein